MSWKRVFCLYPCSQDKKSEQLYAGTASINPFGLEVVATTAARHAEGMPIPAPPSANGFSSIPATVSKGAPPVRGQ